MKNELTIERLNIATTEAIEIMEKYDGEKLPMELDDLKDFATVTAMAGVAVPAIEEDGKLILLGATGENPYDRKPVVAIRATKKVLKTFGEPTVFKIAGEEVNVY